MLCEHYPTPTEWPGRAASRPADQPSHRPSARHSTERPLQPLPPRANPGWVVLSLQKETEEMPPPWNTPLPPCSIGSQVEWGRPTREPSRAPSRAHRPSPAFRRRIPPSHQRMSVLAERRSDPAQIPNHPDGTESCKPKTNKEVIAALTSAIHRPSAPSD